MQYTKSPGVSKEKGQKNLGDPHGQPKHNTVLLLKYYH